MSAYLDFNYPLQLKLQNKHCLVIGGGKVAGLGKAVGTSLREFKEEMHKDETAVKDVAYAAKKE